MNRRILLLTFLLGSRVAVGQTYTWNPALFKLNPSGIQIESKATQFQFLDWNGDGMPDFILNDDGHLVYAEQSAHGIARWRYKELSFPAIGLRHTATSVFPKNFRFFDWDRDGDFDLAADSSRFWWNTGSNLAPIWQQDDTLLADIPFGSNFSFVDYDQDGDWDITSDVENPLNTTAVFLNTGNNQTPVWTRIDTLIPHGYAARFANMDGDSLLDLITVEVLVGTGTPQSAGFGLAGAVNRGTRFNPAWEFDVFEVFWVGNGQNLEPGYDLADYDGDGKLDILKTDWQQHLAVHLNKATSQDKPVFDQTPDELLGPVKMESNARPYVLDADKLVVTGDILVEGFLTIFPDGRIRVYESEAGVFDPSNLLTQNVPQTEFELYPNLKKALTLSFADVDHDGDEDYLMGFGKTTTTGFELYKSTLFYENVGTAEAGVWRVDSTQFVRFQNPDSMFYDPRLVDIDSDGDFDLFIQRDGAYTFYERLNSAEESWRERADWLQGLDDRTHYSAAFVDLSRDGRRDLVFGESNGSLTFYENVGGQGKPVWHLLPDVFAAVNVDSLATPAFYRVDPRGIYDLIVGNAEGKLFYFENLSTVDVEEKPPSGPGTFRLFQNYPNPFNPETTIRFTLAKAQLVQLSVYNLLGQKVTTLVDEKMTAGEHAVIWKPGSQPSGLYFVRLKTTNRTEVRKMILSK